MIIGMNEEITNEEENVQNNVEQNETQKTKKESPLFISFGGAGGTFSKVPLRFYRFFKKVLPLLQNFRFVIN